jgi:hypothetical protein
MGKNHTVQYRNCRRITVPILQYTSLEDFGRLWSIQIMWQSLPVTESANFEKTIDTAFAKFWKETSAMDHIPFPTSCRKTKTIPYKTLIKGHSHGKRFTSNYSLDQNLGPSKHFNFSKTLLEKLWSFKIWSFATYTVLYNGYLWFQ